MGQPTGAAGQKDQRLGHCSRLVLSADSSDHNRLWLIIEEIFRLDFWVFTSGLVFPCRCRHLQEPPGLWVLHRHRSPGFLCGHLKPSAPLFCSLGPFTSVRIFMSFTPSSVSTRKNCRPRQGRRPRPTRKSWRRCGRRSWSRSWRRLCSRSWMRSYDRRCGRRLWRL